jgi:hypothetical protein
MEGVMTENRVKDYTWSVCKDCVNRVLRTVHITMYDPESGEVQKHREEHYYICMLGIELDRHPDQCRYKVLRIPRL